MLGISAFWIWHGHGTLKFTSSCGYLQQEQAGSDVTPGPKNDFLQQKTFNWAYSTRGLESMMAVQRQLSAHMVGKGRGQKELHWKWQESFQLQSPCPLTSSSNKATPPKPLP